MKMNLHLRAAALVFALSAIFALGDPGSVFATGDPHGLRTMAFGKVPSFVTLLSKRAALNATPGNGSAYTIIASGLHNPRGLTFGPGDRLYVAEAGLGGTAEDPVGYNGAIDEIVSEQSAHPTLRTVVFGLASILTEEGDILGVGQISAQGNGGIY